MWSLSAMQQACAALPFATVVLPQVDSTSAWLKRTLPPEPCMVIAYAQTRGYGQHGRGWQMRPGQDLAMTFWLPQSAHLAALPMLTPYVALQLRSRLQPFSDQRLWCKWPNDIYNPAGKVSGTLIERGGAGLMVGCGINWARSDTWPHALSDTRLPWDFLAQWGAWVLTALPHFHARHWQQVMGAWAAVDWFPRGALVEDLQGNRYRYGGIQADGRLLLWQGRQAVYVHSGTCSLRPVDQGP
ncbi:MAG TPA: hypothetical protein EYH46_03000 [Sulfurivirga caldicuralii]|nr:hypothetical protein [Sulfurivirga caldicuralii]